LKPAAASFVKLKTVSLLIGIQQPTNSGLLFEKTILLLFFLMMIQLQLVLVMFTPYLQDYSKVNVLTSVKSLACNVCTGNPILTLF
jgi:hypothetical protein